MSSSASSLMRGGLRLALRSALPRPAASRALSLAPRPAPLLPALASRHAHLTCSVPARAMATSVDGELADFLKQEIATEKQNSRALPKLAGWEVKAAGSEVTLTKSAGQDKVMITLNVNHTVDSAVPDDGEGEAPEMLSKPTFEVDVIKPGGKTLSFTCSYTSDEEHPEEEQGDPEEEVDVFAIDEVTMFEGENHSDECYAVAGDILDGYLYDLFMNLLAERGVDNAFVEELSQWCSAHEHGQYLALLGELERWSKL